MATDDDQDLEEETLSEPSVIKADLFQIFQVFAEAKQEILGEAIKQDGNLPPVKDDEQSVDSYIELNRANIPANHILWKNLEKIELAQQEVVRTKMKQSGEQDLKLSGGGTVDIEGGGQISYRVEDKLKIVDAEPEIDDGPLCLSLPLQDENGRNMKEKDAKYLFINYDDSGKLTHVSHPEPIEFEGNKCCFNIEGKKYYLKIEKQKLEELKKEIEKNRGYEEGRDAKDTALRPDDAKLHAQGMQEVFEDIKNRENKNNPLSKDDSSKDGYVSSEDDNKGKQVDDTKSVVRDKMKSVLDDIKSRGSKKKSNLQTQNNAEALRRALQSNNGSETNQQDTKITNPQTLLEGKVLSENEKNASINYHDNNPPIGKQQPFNADFLKKKQNARGL